MTTPEATVKKMKEVAGYVEYQIGSSTTDVDLGFATLAAGTKGSEFGAVIEKNEKSQWQQGHEEVAVKVNLPSSSIKGIKFLGGNGQPLDVKPSGTTMFDKQTTLSYAINGSFPKKAKVVLEKYDDLKVFQAPFKFSNVPLLGR